MKKQMATKGGCRDLMFLAWIQFVTDVAFAIAVAQGEPKLDPGFYLLAEQSCNFKTFYSCVHMIAF